MYKIYYLTSILDCFQPRYIGYTSKKLESRLAYHVYDSKYKKNRSHKTNWINKILKSGDLPIIIEIDECPSREGVCDLERNYITEFRKWYNLTNSTDGGEISKTYTKEVVEKISKGLREYYKNNNSWNKGLKYKFSKERNQKRREKMGDIIDGENNHFFGKKHSYETRKLLSSIHRKYNYDYKMIYEYYIVRDMNRKEISIETGLPYYFVGKVLTKYKLGPVKKKIYGKLKGRKQRIEDIELLYRYYDHDKI